MKGIRTILCPVDFTSVTEETVHLAAQLCRQMKAKLILHHNLGVRPPGYLSVNWMVSEETGEREQKKEDEVSPIASRSSSRSCPRTSSTRPG